MKSNRKKLKNNLLEIAKLLENKRNIVIEQTLDSMIYFVSKSNYYRIIIPHEGNQFRWMFQRARKSGFDRWANSTNETRYCKNVSEIYSRLKRI